MSSGHVHGDIESLMRFRDHLVSYNRMLAEEFARLEQHWQGLSEVWTDVNYDRLGEALAEVNVGIERYLAEAETHEDHLSRLIERYQAVLDL